MRSSSCFIVATLEYISGNSDLFMKVIFCVLTPCSQVEAYRRFGGTLRGRRVNQTKPFASCRFLASLFLILKMEAVPFSWKSVDFYRTARCCIVGGSTLHIHRCENLKSNKESYVVKNTSRGWKCMCIGLVPWQRRDLFLTHVLSRLLSANNQSLIWQPYLCSIVMILFVIFFRIAWTKG